MRTGEIFRRQANDGVSECEREVVSESDLYGAKSKAERNRAWRKRSLGTTRTCTNCRRLYVVTANFALCPQCFREYGRRWANANREKERERRAIWYKNNSEKARVAGRLNMAKQRALRPIDCDTYTKTWRSANKEKVLHWNLRKNAKRKGAVIGEFTVLDWKQLKNIWGNCCAYCGKMKRLTRDHMMPLIKGGIHDLSNIVPACLSCNTQKCGRNVEEYYQWLEARVNFYKTFLESTHAEKLGSLDKIVVLPGKER